MSSHSNRADGRLPSQIRSLTCSVGNLKEASGSSFVKWGNCSVFCSVNGPHQRATSSGTMSESGALECDVRFAPFAMGLPVATIPPSSSSTSNMETKNEVSARSLMATYGDDANKRALNVLERNLSNVMKDSLESSIRLECYPKAVISLRVVILQSGGGDILSGIDIAACIIAGSLALADANVELYDLVAACNVALISSPSPSSSSTIVVDPSSEEYVDAKGTLALARLPCVDKTTQLWFEGRVDKDVVVDMIRLGEETTSYIRDNFMKECLKEKVQRLMQTKA